MELARDDSFARAAFDNGAVTRAADLYGQAYQQAGDTPRAEDRLTRAQRSLAAQQAKTGETYATSRP